MTTLITGGAGMVGCHLKDIAPDYIYLTREDCDLTKYDQVERIFEFYKPINVVHEHKCFNGCEKNQSG